MLGQSGCLGIKAQTATANLSLSALLGISHSLLHAHDLKLGLALDLAPKIRPQQESIRGWSFSSCPYPSMADPHISIIRGKLRELSRGPESTGL